MRNLSSSRLFLGSGIIWDMALRSWWVSFVVFTVIDLGFTPLQLVLLGTALEVTVLVSEVPTGVLADLYSRKWSIVISYWVVGIGLAASGLFTSFPLLVLTQVLWGLGYTFRSGAEVAWITDEIGVAKTESLLLRRGKVQSLASAGGLALGAILARTTSVRVVIVVSGCVLVTWGFVLALSMNEGSLERKRTETWRSFTSDVREGGRLTWAVPSLRVLLIVMLLIGVASEALDRLGVRRLDQVGFSERYDEVLALTAIAIIGSLIAALLLWFFEARATGANLPILLAVFIGVTAVSAGLLSWAVSLPLAIGALTIRHGAVDAAVPLIEAWTNVHATDKHRATTHSFVGQIEALGEMSGGIIFGIVATMTTVAAALGGSAVLLTLATALVGWEAWRVSPRRRSATENPTPTLPEVHD